MVMLENPATPEASVAENSPQATEVASVKPALFIAGTPNTTPAMLTYTRKAVERAGQRHMRILVGDHPQGVDQAVVAACDEFGVECNVYGTAPQPRNPVVQVSPNCRYIQVTGEDVKEITGPTGTGFQKIPRPATAEERDQLMVDTAERVLCISDAKSPEVKAVYEYAAERGKTADFALEQEGKVRIVQRTYEYNPTSPEMPPTSQQPATPHLLPTPETQVQYPPVYTIGYAGRSHTEIEQLVTSMDATLVDIRYSPRSAKAGFNKSQLKKALGERYLHLSDFGNDNYSEKDDKPIEIHDYEAGLAKLRYETANSERPVVLMCGCKDVHTCHRTVVGQRLQEDGFDFRGDLGEMAIDGTNAETPTPPDTPNPATSSETPPALEVEQTLLESCQAAGLGQEEIASQQQRLLPFQAIHRLGVEAVNFDPNLDTPLIVKNGQALWVGVYQPTDTAQDYAACLLSVSGMGDSDPQAHLAICCTGDYPKVFGAAQELLEAAQGGSPERCLGMAEGMARAYGAYKQAWSNSDGQPLGSTIAAALSQTVTQPALEL